MTGVRNKYLEMKTKDTIPQEVLLLPTDACISGSVHAARKGKRPNLTEKNRYCINELSQVYPHSVLDS